MTEADGAVRDALRRMRIPDHGPDFWDALAGQIDKVEVRRASDRNRRAAAHRDPHGKPDRRGTQDKPVREVSAAIPRPLVEPIVEPQEDAAPARARHDRRRVVVAPVGEDLAPVVEGRFGSSASRDRASARDRDTSRGERYRGSRHVRVERDLAVVPEAMRHQRSNIALAVVAVAAVALVAFAGSSLVRSRTDGGAPESIEAANTAFRADSLAAGSNDPAARAVFTWIGQLADGNTDGAWTSLGPASQQGIGGRAAFDGQFDALADSYGAWSGVQPAALLVTPLAASDEGTVTIVTLIGEAGGVLRTDAIPVRIAGGVATIEAFADAGQIGLETPASSEGAQVGLGDELSVLVPDDVTPVIRLDQGPTQRCGDAPGTSLDDAGGGRQRCTYIPEGGIQAGGRVLTVGFTAPDGPEVSARSVRFNAA